MAYSSLKNREVKVPDGPAVIIGADRIAGLFGVDAKTILRWGDKEGFPLATLPSGHVATTMTLIDGWLLMRAEARRTDLKVRRAYRLMMAEKAMNAVKTGPTLLPPTSLAQKSAPHDKEPG